MYVYMPWDLWRGNIKWICAGELHACMNIIHLPWGENTHTLTIPMAPYRFLIS